MHTLQTVTKTEHDYSYAVDSLILLLQSIIAPQAFLEFGATGYASGMTIAAYVGMLTGAIFWGLSADIIGRRYAFNVSLFICSIAAIIAGAMPNWPGLGFFIAMVGFGGGGNLILDTTVFLEYLPGDKQWVLTFLACWWGLGQAVTGFIAWGFMGEPWKTTWCLFFSFSRSGLIISSSTGKMELHGSGFVYEGQQHGLALYDVHSRCAGLRAIHRTHHGRAAEGNAQVSPGHRRRCEAGGNAPKYRAKVQPPLHAHS